jgi:hypothetical protein
MLGGKTEMIRSYSYLKGRCGAVLASLAVIWIAAPCPAWGQQWNGTNPVWTNSNVGIGTTAPAAKLHLSGASPSLRLTASIGNWAGIQFENAALSTPVRWVLYTGASGQPGDHISFFDYVSLTDRFTIDASGNVGIGTSNPTYKLSVNGTIRTKEVIVDTAWSDYVFKPGYRLKSLKEVAVYIKANRHLPGIPSEAEVKEQGVSVGQIESKLLAKVEELTLHMIQAEERNDRLEQENRKFQERITRLEGRSVR